MDDSDVKCRLVEKLLRARVLGGKNWTIDHLVNVALRDSDQGRGRQLLENEMIPQAEAGVQRYGGQRDAVQLTNVATAVKFLEDNDGNVPFGFD